MKRYYYISEVFNNISNTRPHIGRHSDAVSKVLIQWKEQLYIDGRDFFHLMLKANTISEIDLQSILQNYFSTSVTKEVSEDRFPLFSDVNKNAPLSINPFSKELLICSNEIVNFIKSFRLDNIKDQIEILLKNLFYNLFLKIIDISKESLSLEFEVANDDGQFINHKDPVSQYNRKCLSEHSFIYYLKNEYPVLFRLVGEETEKLTQNFKEFIVRFQKDIGEIIQNNKEFESNIVRIEGYGAPRENGKQIHILQFESKKLVYKPWDLKMQKAYGEFLLFTSSTFKYKFTTPFLIVKEGYGWMEFISQHDDFSKTALKQFYHMTGNLLALFYVLDGTDLYVDNIIYSESGPIIIDCETLFHPEEYVVKDDRLKPELKNNDVLKTGPLVFLSNDKVADTHFYIDDCIDGFKECYSYFYKNSALLYSKIKDIFRDVEIRVVLRDNKIYNHLRMERLKPEVMTDGYKSDMHFDWLWGHVNELEYLEKVICFEKLSLMKNEIPVFTTYFKSKDLYYNGLKVVTNFFYYSAEERLQLKLDRLGEKDLNEQVALIRKYQHLRHFA